MRARIGLFFFSILMTLSNFGFSNTVQDSQAGDAERHPRAPHFALGFDLTAVQRDFGLGLNLTSPYFAHEAMAIRVHGGVSWLEAMPKDKAEYEWMLYVPIRLGMVISVGMVGGFARFYAEAGPLLFVPVGEFTDDLAVGGYGLIGFEFFTTKKSPVTYYIDAGGMGSGGNAEKLAGSPSWANGFLIDVGVRWYLY